MHQFIVELIMDLYEVDMKTSKINDDEFDSWFLNDDGTYMTDEEYIKEHKQEFLEQELIDSISVTILDEEDEEYTYEDILKQLIYKFIIINYSNPELRPVISFLRTAPLNSISELFEENLGFQRSLVSSYIESITEEEQYQTNLDKINQNKDTILEQYKYIEKPKENKVEIESLNNILRNVIINLYNFFAKEGLNDLEIARNIREYFLNNFDPLGDLDKMGYSIQEKQMLKLIILKIMYMDLYEDLLNNPCITPKTRREQTFEIIPKIAIDHVNGLMLPADDDCFAYHLKWFMLLYDLDDKKRANRTRTLNDEQTLKLIKRNYPLFFLDEIDYK